MQLANSREGDPALRDYVRQAGQGDAAAIQTLLRTGAHVHIHLDWRLPGEWIGQPGFVVFDRKRPPEEKMQRAADGISGCLAIAAAPPPAAWVRVAAVTSHRAFPELEAMFRRVLDVIDPAIEEIAWFLTDYWPLQWLELLGFRPISEVLGFRKEGLDGAPFTAPDGLVIRPLMMEDIPALVEIEAAAFEPRWRHSSHDLYLAWRNSISFTVALLDDRPAGFQFSTGHDRTAHLSRMTVHPDQQGLGIGAALLANALEDYRRQNVSTISLNTQTDNTVSRRLYERFGFRETGYSYPIWSFFPQ